MSIIETLTTRFPVRKTRQQKQAFRAWVLQQCENMGYAAKEEQGRFCCNVIAGDPDTAKVIYTAHYDTPPVMPVPNFITPLNKAIYFAYQIIIAVVILAAAVAAGSLLGYLTHNVWAGEIGYFGMAAAVLALMMFGPANKTNVNDNTSGVAAVLELMQHLPEQERAKAAFILFDNEEKGLLGSADYAKKHPDHKAGKLLINMDCVGDGETVLFFAKKKARELPEYELLESAMQQQTGRELIMMPAEKGIYPSDQANFACGIAVCACRHGEKMGYYCDKIHTAKDTVCEQVNLDYLACGLASFTSML